MHQLALLGKVLSCEGRTTRIMPRYPPNIQSHTEDVRGSHRPVMLTLSV